MLGDITHHGVGDVRNVDHHPESVHLAHHFHSESRESLVARQVGGRVGPGNRAAVGERHVSHANGVELPQYSERILDGVAPLDADE